MKTILAIDCGTVSGWATWAAGEPRPRSGTFRAPPAIDGEFGRTFAAFQEWLAGMVSMIRPDLICFEAPLVMASGAGPKVRTNHNTGRMLFGFATIVEMVAFQAGVDVAEVNISTARKHFVGTGRAEKRMVYDRACALGWAPNSADAADALAVLDLARATTSPASAAYSTLLFGEVGR